jgi:hypothetical protein
MNEIDSLVQRGITALKAGNKTAAREFLEQALMQDIRNETAWLWLSGAVESDQERLECLEQVIAINPANTAAQKGISILRKSIGQITPSIATPPKVETPERIEATPPQTEIEPQLIPADTFPEESKTERKEISIEPPTQPIPREEEQSDRFERTDILDEPETDKLPEVEMRFSLSSENSPSETFSPARQAGFPRRAAGRKRTSVVTGILLGLVSLIVILSAACILSFALGWIQLPAELTAMLPFGLGAPSDRPPGYGVFLKNGAKFTEIEMSTGAPTVDKLYVSPTNTPEIVFWDQRITPESLLLVTSGNEKGLSTQEFNILPKGEYFYIVPKQPLIQGTYCFVFNKDNPSVSSGSWWCLKVNESE